MVPPQPGRAAGPRYVAPGGDDGNTCLDADNPCATIQTVVDKADLGSGVTIYVAVGTYVGSGAYGVVSKSFLHNIVFSGGWNNDFTLQTGMSTIDGQNSRRGLYLRDSTVTLDRFIVENGYNDDGSNGGAMYGGAIYTNGTTSDSLTITNSVIRNNSALFGGAIGIEGGTVVLNNSVVNGNVLNSNTGCNSIFTYGTLIMNNSTVSGNNGGNTSICLRSSAANVYINSSTIANNHGNGVYPSMGLHISIGNVFIQNSILADNAGDDCFNDYGTFTSSGYNLIESQQGCTTTESDILNTDPHLGPLFNYGSLTLTQALLFGSPAIDAGNPAGCMGSDGVLDSDQRGFPRYGRCDIGAYEAQHIFPVFLPIITR